MLIYTSLSGPFVAFHIEVKAGSAYHPKGHTEKSSLFVGKTQTDNAIKLAH